MPLVSGHEMLHHRLYQIGSEKPDFYVHFVILLFYPERTFKAFLFPILKSSIDGYNWNNGSKMDNASSNL